VTSTSPSITDLHDQAQSLATGAAAIADAAAGAAVRIPVSSLPGNVQAFHVITERGHYILTENLVTDGSKSAIRINASDVTLDLNGFAVIATAPGNAWGIESQITPRNIVVRNGTVTGFGNTSLAGSGGGVQLSIGNCLVEDIRVIDVDGDGVWVLRNSVVRRCMVSAARYGVIVFERCVVRDCVAFDCSAQGISAGLSASVTGCAVRDCESGISADRGTTVTECVSTDSVIDGFTGQRGTVIVGCVASGSGQSGFVLYGSSVFACLSQANVQRGFLSLEASTITRCLALDNGVGGYFLNGDGIRIEDCVAADHAGTYGFRATGLAEHSAIFGNFSEFTLDDYDIQTGSLLFGTERTNFTGAAAQDNFAQ